ncbi:glycosyltransferase family 9 protein [Desulfovibrio mangrovi]|uniref:glycosyltransferase family 9 protein n=1 Tax=Desulfovibrio mangrovi TaxID=2976983 RepID=UPI002248626E|nr:glycosyltransferase family 9 protein [Desulfovibrio mangrovi]UZP68348.1 glycosyltransferase family 9 protein [Desulfovibrio mangrovi]
MAKYLVIQLARFGDLLQTKRLILSLQQDLGQGAAEVHLCIDSSLSALAAHVYPDVKVHAIKAHGTSTAEEVLFANLTVFSAMQAEKYDAVYNLNFSGLSFAIATLFDPETVHGYRSEGGQPLKDQWMRLAFRWTRNRRTSPLNLMDFWGLLAPAPIVPEAVNPIAMRKGGGLGVVLAGRNSRRSLPVDMLADCVQAVFEAHGGPKVTLLGTKAEAQLGSQLMRKFSGPLLQRTENLVGRTDFSGLIDTVGGLDVLLTPDTGTMHLAAHLGTPVQAFFLSSAWAHETGPYGLGHRIWQAVLPCSPCLESRPCPIDTQCLNAFADPKYLRILAGKFDDDYPANIIGLVSMLDAVGVTYMPVFGLDDGTPQRKDQRGLVAERFGLMELAPVADNTQAASLYQESDWMLSHERTAPGDE